MRVLIIEDEARIAQRIERMLRELLATNLVALAVCDSLTMGKAHLSAHQIDLLFLDLNLNGEDGFEMLKSVTAEAFHTIIISAYKEKAITAFEYGVLDFIGKPFDKDRLALALAKFNQSQRTLTTTKFLSVKNKGNIYLIKTEEVNFIKGADIYTEIQLLDGRTFLHDKSLERLENLLPHSFIRIHKSYLVPIAQFDKINVQSGGKYSLLLKSGHQLPIGRSRYEQVKSTWH